MQVVRITTTNGIDDIKLIGETEQERLFIKQLAEAGTLSCLNRDVADSVLFRPISVTQEMSTYASAKNSIGKYDFMVVQNETHLVELKFSADGSPLDLTMYQAIKLQVKTHKSAPAVFELALGNGLVVSGEDANILKVTFSAEQTKSLNCESYYYDVLMSTPTANVYYLEGKITIKKTATR